MDTTLRYKCRFLPHCGRNLPEPVENPHHAFCTPGCHSSFYRKHCLVCDRLFAEVDQGRAALATDQAARGAQILWP
jgi:hypothetical protein